MNAVFLVIFCCYLPTAKTLRVSSQITMFSKNYRPLTQQDSIENLEDSEKLNDAYSIQSTQNSAIKLLSRAVTRWALWMLVTSLVLTNWYTWVKLRSCSPPNAIYTLPAQSSIKYKNIVFNAGIDGDLSPYQGLPNAENNALWEGLDPQHYGVIISVFHQLHCLNNLRKRIFWNETTRGPIAENPDFGMKHMDHCIDSLRQSLMCSSDLTPIPYAWNTKYHQTLPVPATTHTCRDFEAIRDWARAEERRAGEMDVHVRVEDPLGNVEYTAPDSEDV
ncbi:unnamed protein product [Periconia digitata]|uniref:Uncharacterized protein n=1 Tax=Periconia digitata TaxID=1303443 RepID=A0A9W4UKC5_9PLEO|nr:unnamed protein product [Periconia digitata]